MLQYRLSSSSRLFKLPTTYHFLEINVILTIRPLSPFSLLSLSAVSFDVWNEHTNKRVISIQLPLFWITYT